MDPLVLSFLGLQLLKGLSHTPPPRPPPHRSLLTMYQKTGVVEGKASHSTQNAVYTGASLAAFRGADSQVRSWLPPKVTTGFKDPLESERRRVSFGLDRAQRVSCAIPQSGTPSEIDFAGNPVAWTPASPKSRFWRAVSPPGPRPQNTRPQPSRGPDGLVHLRRMLKALKRRGGSPRRGGPVNWLPRGHRRPSRVWPL